VNTILNSSEYKEIEYNHKKKTKKYFSEINILTQQYLKKLEDNLDIIKKRRNIKKLSIQSEKDTIDSKYNYIKSLEELHKSSNYKIVFIGKIGVGKTSAISHSQNLIYQKEYDKKNRNGKIIGKEIKLEEILSTNTGRTTICEVEINFKKESSSIIIEPLSQEDMKIEIEDTVTKLIENNDKDKTIDISEEIFRAIKNMANYNVWSETDKESFKKLSKKEAYDFFIKKLNLDNRNDTTLNFNGNTKIEKEWLADNFKNINYGLNNSFSIPKRITLNINSQIINNPRSRKLYQVVDTKGIDEEPIECRKDLREYISDKKSICILCSNYTEAPTKENIELLKLANKSEFNLYKMGILVIDKNESQKTKNDNGESTDRIEALEIKKQQIKNSLNSYNIEHNELIEFYDIKNEDDDESILNDFIDKTIKEYRLNIIKKLEKEVIYLWEYCYHLPFQIEKRIENREKIKEKLENELINLKKKFYLEEDNLFEEYYKKIFKLHHMKIMALNRRNGKYNGFNNLDTITYYMQEYIKTSIFNNFYTKFYKEFKESLDIKDSQLDLILTTINFQLKETVEKYIKIIQSNITFTYLDNIFYKELRSYWGQGTGYLDKVKSKYEEEFNDISNNIRIHIKNEINNISFDKIINNI